CDRRTQMISAAAITMRVTMDTAGVPHRGDTFAKTAGTRRSRASENSSLLAAVDAPIPTAATSRIRITFMRSYRNFDPYPPSALDRARTSTGAPLFVHAFASRPNPTAWAYETSTK